MGNSNTLVVVSHYEPNPKQPLAKLTGTLESLAENILVVVNDDAAASESIESAGQSVRVIRRPNTGMNIGGWDSAFHAFPDYDFYIFLQDECQIVRDDFIVRYAAELSKDGIGMTGESINPKWAFDWNTLAHSPLNYDVGVDQGGLPVSRVEYYLSCMKKWGVQPGVTGRHLRSLIWAFNRHALARIKGFPIGLNKEECIASEIAVSKMVEQHGLAVTQIAEEPFEYIWHTEWQRDGQSKIQKVRH